MGGPWPGLRTTSSTTDARRLAIASSGTVLTMAAMAKARDKKCNLFTANFGQWQEMPCSATSRMKLKIYNGSLPDM